MSYRYFGSSSSGIQSGSAAGAGSFVALNTSNNLVLATPAGGGGTPGGSTTQFQFNSGGSFAGSPRLTTDGSAITGSDFVVTGSSIYAPAVLGGIQLAQSFIDVTSAGTGVPLEIGSYRTVRLSSGSAASSLPKWDVANVELNVMPGIFEVNELQFIQRYDLAGVDQNNAIFIINDAGSIYLKPYHPTAPVKPKIFFQSGSAGAQGMAINLGQGDGIGAYAKFENAAGEMVIAISGSSALPEARRLYFYDIGGEHIGGNSGYLTYTAEGGHLFTGSVFKNIHPLTFGENGTASVPANVASFFSLTVTGSQHLENPSSLLPGGSYTFIFTQDGTGGRTLSYGDAYKWPGGITGTLSTGANDVDILSAITDGTNLYCSLTKDFS